MSYHAATQYQIFDGQNFAKRDMILISWLIILKVNIMMQAMMNIENVLIFLPGQVCQDLKGLEKVKKSFTKE